MRSSQTVVTLIAFALALAMAVAIGITRHDEAGAASETIAGTALMRLGQQWSLATNQDAYRYVIVGRAAASEAAAQPGMSLVYHSGLSVVTSWDAGVPFSVAEANGWLLRDAAGEYLRSKVYPDNYVADVGSAAYQAEWARRVGDYLASVGVDGVYIDDVVADVLMLAARRPAKYPTQAACEDAMASFINNVGGALKARGFYVLVNAGKWVEGNSGSDDGSLTAQWWRRLSPGVSGYHNEYFLQSPIEISRLRGEGPAWNDHWSGWVGLVDVAESLGRDFFGLSYGSTTNTEAMRYVRASFLLAWNGGGGGVLYQNESGDPWSSEWMADVGVAVGDKYQVGVGWRRAYSGGTVLVNPNPTSSQTFALGGTYSLPDGSPTTSVTLGPKSGLILRSATAAAPVNVALPTVDGTAQQGLVVSSTTGSWSGSPTAYLYQWHRCDAGGAGCDVVVAATERSYRLSSSDVGKTLRVRVTAANSGGSASAMSAASNVVVPAPPANVTLPTISGSAELGVTLSASPGTWTNEPTFKYQWQRCAGVDGTTCSGLSGAEAASYTLAAADVGNRLRVVVLATNPGGSASATSLISAVVTAPPSGLEVDILPNGKPKKRPKPPYVAAPDCDRGGSACLQSADSPTPQKGPDAGALGNAQSAAPSPNGPGPMPSPAPEGSLAPSPGIAPAIISLPAVTGAAQEASELASSPGTWQNNPTSYAYQWRRCNASGERCSDVEHATEARYSPTSADVGRTLRVVVAASNAFGAGSSTSDASRVVAPSPAAPAPQDAVPTSTSPPSVNGPERVDKTATASGGSWDGNPTELSYQWLRCADENVASCVEILGATRPQYTFAGEDRDHFVIVRVSATNGAGSGWATSRFGRPVKG